MGDKTDTISRNAKNVADRLEKLSADSVWAHKASGLRRSLLRGLRDLENADLKKLQTMVAHGYEILNHAARQIPDNFDP